MRFNVLGSLEVIGPDGPLPINGGRLRGFLSALLMRAGHPISVDRLIEALWGERPPSSALANVRTYAYQLRRMLEGSDAQLSTQNGAYRLDVGSQQLDLSEYQGRADDGLDALARKDFAQAAIDLRAALRLWRGRAFEGQEFTAWMAARVIALEDHHRATWFAWAEANLALGQPAHLIPRLRELVAENPLSEQAWLQLITALHRCGHTGDALTAYHEARRVLADELGLEPGPQLRQAQLIILRQTADVGQP